MERTNGNLQMIISEKEERIQHHKSQIYETEVGEIGKLDTVERLKREISSFGE